jgi:hypothetical protein
VVLCEAYGCSERARVPTSDHHPQAASSAGLVRRVRNVLYIPCATPESTLCETPVNTRLVALEWLPCVN